jgi:hypothetical protein
VKPSISRTLVAGLAGGAAFSVASFLTFVLIGSGPLFDPDMQSPKLIAVWTQMEPLPLFVAAPYVVLLGYLLFGIGHAFLFRSVAAAWPEGAAPRTWRLAVVIWGLSCLFFEFLGPFNLLGEPLSLVALELSFWATAALADSTVVVSMLRQGRLEERERDSREHNPTSNQSEVTEMSSNVDLPWWLGPSNRVVVALQRLGVIIGTMRLLSVPGRKSGKLRTTPVSPLTVEGRRYIVGGFPQAGWVKNARAADWAILARGRKEEQVTLLELPPEKRAPILRKFPSKVPHGVQFFVQAGLVKSPDPEAFAEAASRCIVFEVLGATEKTA